MSILFSRVTNILRHPPVHRIQSLWGNSSIMLNRCSRCYSVRAIQGKKKHSFREGGYILLVIPALTFYLGTWQVKRRRWKLNLIQDLKERSHTAPIPLPMDLDELKDLEYRRVSVEGVFDHSREVIVTPRSKMIPEDERQGSGLISSSGGHGGHVVTPFTLTDRDLTILVNRGWVPKKLISAETRLAGQISGPVELVGVVRTTDKRHPLGKRVRAQPGAWLQRDVEAMAQALGTEPVFLDADHKSTVSGGPLGGQTHVTLRNEHFSYIITWYSLTAFTSFMWYQRFWKRIR